MKKKISAGFLALVFLLQAFLPGLVYANQANPKYKKPISEGRGTQDNLITIGKLKGVGLSQDNPTASISIEEIEEKNHKNKDALDGLEISDENIPQALMSSNSPYIQGQQPADPDKPKYWANVQGTLTTRGIDGTTFDWEKILGKGAKVKLLFTQTNGNVMTGVTYSLLVDKDGTYTWHGSDGKPTYLPLYDANGNPYTYNVQIERNYDKNVQLIIQESNGTPKAKFRQEGDKQVATISFLDIGIQQVASTKFVSEWHTSVADGDRPQIEGYFEADTDVDNDFNFPKNDTTRTILRSSFVENFVEDEENGPWSFLSSEIEKTPKTVEVKTTTAGLTFEEKDGVKTVKSGNHKFKYDFTYDVINGGKLTMTEIIPVTFDTNGGKFANFTAPDTETKIVKEVEYDGTLTDKAEDPTKDRETFKGWATTQDGKPLSEADFKVAIQNIKEAKEFFAIWDNNEIQAEELTVHESFKDGTGYVNDFIPTLDQLKGQVKIKDANGTPQALVNDDTFAIVNGSNEYKADGDDLKNYLYKKLQEKANSNDEPTRIETVKAKVTHANGTSQTVDIPIKVIKNIYEAKTETKPPFYVPSDYVKVTVDPTTKAQDPQKYFYYVNPAAKVVIPGSDPVGVDGNTFTKWLIKGTTDEYKLADKPRHMFTAETTIEAQYVSDVIPANDDGSKPDTVPANFVEVKFVPTDKATDTTEKIYWVNPNVKVTIPVNNPVGKTYYTFKEWKIGDVTTGETYTVGTAKQFTDTLTTITATYEESKSVIPYNPSLPDPMVRPEGYVRVTFAADPGLKLTEQKAYYVKKNAGITLGNEELVKPGYEAETGYKFKEWDKKDDLVIEATDIVVTAKATKLDNVIPEKKEDGTPNEKPEGYKEVTFVVKTGDEAKGSITGVAKFYVNPTEYVTINPPATKAETGYKFGSWDKDATIPTVYKEDATITGSFNDLKDVIPKTNPDGTENKQPAGYKTVTFVIDPATGGKIADKEVKVYYVNPAKEVTVPQPKTAADTGYEFEKWDPDTTTAKKYAEDTTVKGNFKKLDDIIPATNGNGQPNAKPNGYVTVTFEKGEHGKEIKGQTVYYVNPNANTTLGNEKIVKPTVTPETGWEANGWNKEDTQTITGDLTVTAKYAPIDDVIPKDKPTGGENDKPEGYITVTFDKGANGELEGNTVFYVNPNKAVVLEDKAPTIKPNTGYTSAGWDTSINKAIQYKDGDKITALYNELGDVIPQEKTDGSDKPAGYLTVTFDKGDHGELSGKTVYYVKPNKEVTVPAPHVKPSVGYEFDKWDKALTQTFAENTKITAEYKELDDIIPQDKTDESDKPDGYHKVIFKAVNGNLEGKTVYYVKPDVDIDLTNTANNITKKANVGYTADGGTWKPEIISKKYTADSEYEFNFKKLADIIPSTDPTTGETNAKPEGYVTVTFDKGEHGKEITGQTVYYVNPNANITLGNEKIVKPTVTPETGWEADGWDKEDTQTVTGDLTVTAKYAPIDDVIPKDKPTGGENDKPDGYIEVIFSTEANGKIKGTSNTTKVVYVNPNKAVELKPYAPEVTPDTGYDFADWNTQIEMKIQYSDGYTIKALYNEKDDVIPQKNTDGSDKPAGYLTVTFDKGEHGTLSGQTVYYVKPNKKVTVPAPTVTPAGGFKFSKWDKELTQTFTEDTTITAKYEKLPDVKPGDDTDKPGDNGRIGGGDRIDTAVEISKQYYKKAKTVIVARSDDFPDALTASVLARALDAPILLTRPGHLSESVKAEIERLGADKIYIIGRENAVSLGVEKELRGLGRVKRLGGIDRFETSTLVAKEVVSIVGNKHVAVIATGLNFADALSISPFAAKNGYPILLVRQNKVPKVIKKTINELGIGDVYIVGEKMAVSRGLEKELPRLIERVGGSDRYETSAMIASNFFSRSKKAFMASGQVFADALVIGPVAARENAPVLLTARERLPKVMKKHIDNANYQDIVLVGLRNAISREVEEAIR